MDVITQNILRSARELNILLSEELANKVLEVKISSDSSTHHNLLGRLIRSLDQYVNKNRGLKYIGLVGHYSSGKSSTINSILNLKDTSDERDSDLNPTDKAITLITHPKNSSFLILMTKEGSAVPIRTSFINRDLLQDVVLSDTPGSGDPDVVNELIQDFLPICDWIFYFIMSTNPLDQADIPLLTQKTAKLPFIPISFVITRSDEFRIDRNKQLSDNNLDRTKLDAFLGKLVSRLCHTLKIDDIPLNKFTFIDNEAQYNIDKLRDAFLNNTTSIDEQSLIEMHAHKIEFYRNGLNSIFNHYLKSLSLKIQQCEEFIKTANDNISRFDRSVNVNSEKMKLMWSKGALSFSEAFNHEKSEIEQLKTSSYISHLIYDKNYIAEKKQLFAIVDSQANGYIGKLVADINLGFKNRIREVKYNLEKNVESANLLKEDIAHLFTARLDYEFPEQTLEIDFSKFHDTMDSINSRLISILYEVKGAIRYQLNHIKTITSKEELINRLAKLYSSGRSAIYENFAEYFDKIEMYQSAVLTKNTKETIEKLRIGGQLDALDKNFSESFMSGMKTKAVDSVYEPFDKPVDELRQKGEQLNRTVMELKKGLEGVSVNKEELTKLPKDIINVSALIGEISQKKEQVINLIYQDKLVDVIDSHRQNYRKYEDHLVELKRYRRKQFFIWGLSILVLCIVGFVLYKTSSLASPTTSLGEIIISIGSTLLLDSFILLIVHFKTSIKRVKNQKEKEFVAKAKADILQEFSESFWDDLTKKVGENIEVNNGYVRDKIGGKIHPIIDGLLLGYQKTLEELLAVHKSMESNLQIYKQDLTNFYNKFSLIFSQSDSNSEKISAITKEIKEQSIKPSFELLDETWNGLHRVDQKIKKLVQF
jgi:predicted GTPase